MGVEDNGMIVANDGMGVKNDGMGVTKTMKRAPLTMERASQTMELASLSSICYSLKRSQFHVSLIVSLHDEGSSPRTATLFRHRGRSPRSSNIFRDEISSPRSSTLLPLFTDAKLLDEAYLHLVVCAWSGNG